jgi:hypothetical protein
MRLLPLLLLLLHCQLTKWLEAVRRRLWWTW